MHCDAIKCSEWIGPGVTERPSRDGSQGRLVDVPREIWNTDPVAPESDGTSVMTLFCVYWTSPYLQDLGEC